MTFTYFKEFARYDPKQWDFPTASELERREGSIRLRNSIWRILRQAQIDRIQETISNAVDKLPV